MSQTNIIPLPAPAVPKAAEIKAMIEAARAGALNLARDFEENARFLAEQAAEIATMGDALPPGIVESARQMADQVTGHANRIRAVLR